MFYRPLYLVIIFIVFQVNLNAFWGLYFKNKTIRSNLAQIDTPPKNSGLDSIDCIYYVNLDRRPEKLKYIQNFLHENRLQGTRVHAVDGSFLSEKTISKLLGKKSYPLMTPGGIGCALSHYSIWQHAYDHGYNRIWIIEDDVEALSPVSGLTAILDELEKADPYWDVLYTDRDTRDWNGNTHIRDCSPWLKHPAVGIDDPHYYLWKANISDTLIKIHMRDGTYSMILSKAGIKKILKNHVKNNVWAPCDHSIHVITDINQYAIKYPLVTHAVENRISDTD